jgi:hypothetical protein
MYLQTKILVEVVSDKDMAHAIEGIDYIFKQNGVTEYFRKKKCVCRIFTVRPCS